MEKINKETFFLHNPHHPIGQNSHFGFIILCFYAKCILGLVEVIELPGVVITEFELVVLAGECTWLLPYEEQFPTLAHTQTMHSFKHIVRYIHI